MSPHGVPTSFGRAERKVPDSLSRGPLLKTPDALGMGFDS